MTPLAVDVALAAGASLGEGPVWDEDSSTLVWVDILGQAVHRFDPSTGGDVAFATPSPVGAAGLAADGGLVLALVDGFARCRADGGGLAALGRTAGGGRFATDRAAVRFNDGKVDPAGRWWAGTMHTAESEARGSLYRLDADGLVTEALSGVTVSNGLAWSADGRILYYIDSPTGGVDAFDVAPEDASLSGRRRVVSIPPEDGVPDGMTIDAEGCLWVALWGGGQVRRYAVDGRLLAVVGIPVSRPTSAAFGGEALDQLYVTSARVGLTEEELAKQPQAGSLFVCAAGVSGVEAPRFAG